jgi:hypothetical protein
MDKEKIKTQRQKLGMMRQMLKHAEQMPGWEDKADVIREEIKEQLVLSNAEQGITREQQGAIYLQQVQWKDKEKKDFKKAMIYHQQKTDYNTREYQKIKLEIRSLYAELEEVGWNQVVSDDEWEEGDSVSSDDAAAYMAANANVVRRADRARETPEERRARRARNRQGPPAVVNLLSDDDMDVEPARQPQAAQAPAGPPQAAAGAGQARQPQAAPAPAAPPQDAAGRQQAQQQGPPQGAAAQAPIAPGSVAAAQAHAAQAAQALAAEWQVRFE